MTVLGHPWYDFPVAGFLFGCGWICAQFIAGTISKTWGHR